MQQTISLVAVARCLINCMKSHKRIRGSEISLSKARQGQVSPHYCTNLHASCASETYRSGPLSQISFIMLLVRVCDPQIQWGCCAVSPMNWKASAATGLRRAQRESQQTKTDSPRTSAILGQTITATTHLTFDLTQSSL